MKYQVEQSRYGRTTCYLWMFMTTIAAFSASLYLLHMVEDSEGTSECILTQLLDQPPGWRKAPRSISVLPEALKEEKLDSEPAVDKFKQRIEMMPHDKASVLRQYLENGSTACHHVPTARAHVFGLPLTAEGDITLTPDEDHDLLIVSYAEKGQRRCSGGDFYEVDLSGPRWKARPPVQDLGDGTYLVRLRVDGQFEDAYQLKIILLFGNLHGMDRSPENWPIYNMTLGEPTFLVTVNFRNDPQRIGSAPAQLPVCWKEDFERTSWQGRWTRRRMNETCTADAGGRFQCIPTNETCDSNWCTGPVGSLESNGWVYSTHCSFRIFTQQEAWSCLKDKWLYFWGDSNHQDTVRNLLNFYLGFNLHSVPRSSDQNYTNPGDLNETLRITTVFNGHHDDRFNYKGLVSLQNNTYRDRLRSSFRGPVSEGGVPDAVILNSGLHDCHFWSNFTHFVEAAENASTFWHSTWSGVDVHKRPKVVYRTTIAPAGPDRIHTVNPQKVETMNTVIVDSFVSKFGRENLRIVDEFDMSFPWHYDKLYSDGAHYGRPPREGGQHYFVDLMLTNVLLNAICPL